ncbi:hypothetical protein OG2516_02339 [Oceanicola granulosus HTCC2516]|uniref:Hedgehog/Intein (Hint) domain-containing protein n=1 Tax=Oceanicola granulosus (strain ATCC BAA-861 / DSM 15982 / KCTC 12143 / HTCC2516) TaxID=314256 RepID=Q2CHQ6_OCEGH|nr:Hint domain-containing protein [Oceanicola granulosus]EAR52238.1 hypothetical protein OG2516_02339 [Oceanicola granulosus HTCC2516]
MDLETNTAGAAAGGARVDTTQEVTGFCAGTSLMTMDGELPVEHLGAGDRIITRDSGMAVLREVRVRDVELTPIRIKAGSLGHTRPDRDMLIAPDALVHIRDWRAEAMFGARAAMVPARRLIDGEFISPAARTTARVYDLVFDRQHVLYADGLEVASAAV